MERAEGLLGGKFLFKRQNDETIDKTKVVCSICQIEFSYHRSSSSLSYHLNAKPPTEKFSSSLKLPHPGPLVTTGHQSAMTITWVSQLLLVTTEHQSAMTITWVSQ